jgi:hypothetical protein
MAIEKLSSGVYTVYRTDEGGFHIAYRENGTDEDRHFDFPKIEGPADMMKFAMSLSNGSQPGMANMLKGLVGGA